MLCLWRFGHRDWTQLGTAGRPWYPTMRVFQPLPGQGLDDVMQRIAADLRRLPRENGTAAGRGGKQAGKSRVAPRRRAR